MRKNKVPKQLKKKKRTKAKATTNMVQKVNVKINSTTPQNPYQNRPLPPSIVSYPVYQQQPNSTQIIPHQLQRNPFDSIAFQEKLDTRINNLQDMMNTMKKPTTHLVNPTLQPEAVKESLQPEPVKETLEPKVALLETIVEEEEQMKPSIVTPNVTPNVTPRISIPNNNKEKWIMNSNDNTLISSVTGITQNLDDFKQISGNDYINRRTNEIYNSRSKMLRRAKRSEM
jgi:hypothetical protein